MYLSGSQCFRLAIMASGRGSNMESILDAIDEGSLQMRPAVVISDKQGAQALKKARDRGITCEVLPFEDYDGRDDYGRAILDVLGDYEVEVVALAGFMRVLSEVIVHGFEGPIFNIHPSLLPAFRGLNAQKQALQQGVKVSGCTVHFVDEGVDTGPIILQAVVPVYQDDDVESLSLRILKWEHRLYPRALRLWGEDRLQLSEGRVRILDE